MGQLEHFDIKAAMQAHDLRRFVETGTGSGESLAVACDLPFTSLWSCEIEPLLASMVKKKFIDDRVTLFLGPSSTMLDWLPRLPGMDRILFWLDAHFPGADFGLRGYADVLDESMRLPLRDELALIKRHRPHNEDVIIIDDARIWLDETFEAGPIPDNLLACRPAQLGIGFIHDLFAESHRIDILPENQGYIILTPKSFDGIAVGRK